jgi:hypothetical protein
MKLVPIAYWHAAQHSTSPVSSQNRRPQFETLLLSFIASLAASTHSRGIPGREPGHRSTPRVGRHAFLDLRIGLLAVTPEDLQRIEELGQKYGTEYPPVPAW